jgi:hypothetical protein
VSAVRRLLTLAAWDERRPMDSFQVDPPRFSRLSDGHCIHSSMHPMLIRVLILSCLSANYTVLI